MHNSTSTRRRILTLTAGATGIGLAGCLGNGDDDTSEPANGNSDVNDDADWEDIDEFYFEGRIQAWTGIEPALIEGQDNPTIVLLEGEEYGFRWVNEDGSPHNLEIRGEDGDVIDEYATEDISGEDEEATLENVVATEEMATYVCRFHQGTQVGDIDVRTA